MSLGEDRVRLEFNVTGNPTVDGIKKRAAHEIDRCANALKDHPQTDESRRLWALAMTAYEEAAMWAVKAATAKVDKA
jgi:hypothetical protein